MVPESQSIPKRVQGKALWQALGFANERAFQRDRQAGGLAGLRLYPIDGQSRGVYARADELDQYLTQNGGRQAKGGAR